MLSILNTWQVCLIGYLISFVAFYQFYKLAVRNAKKDGAATILLQIIAGVSILVLTPFLGWKLPNAPILILLLIIACIFYAINDRLQTTSRKHLPVSTFSIIAQLSTVFLILFGFTVFRNPFVWSKLFGAGLILLGNIILLYRNGKFELTKYVVIGILATAALAVAMSIDIGISKQFNLPFYIMLTLVIPASMITVGERIKPMEVAQEFKDKNRIFYLACGIAWGLAIFFSLRSYQLGGQVTTIVPLQAVSVLLNVIIAYIFLKERENSLKKLVAAFLVISGICLTVLG
jgi:drug/metabolite transporter (DMT)-like permease